jgi:hemolysin III
MMDQLFQKLNAHAYLEEYYNRLTHGLGIALGIIGLFFLIYWAFSVGGFWRIFSAIVYGVSLVFMYTSSTIYHSIQQPKLRYIFKIVDHASIYIFIAGSYTPLSLILLDGAFGWTIFGIIWGMALFGVLYKIFYIDRYRIFSIALYLGMGWMALFALEPIVSNLPAFGVFWLFAGGLAYTVGIVFYVWERLPFNHAIWHIFVLGGSLSHYILVLFYLLPFTA